MNHRDSRALFSAFRCFSSRLAVVLALGSGPIPLASSCSGASESDDAVVVCSKPAPDYHRERVQTGGFKPEYYAFGEGGYFPGPIKDANIDGIKFADIAHVAAISLATQNFLPSEEPTKTGLLVMVYWGVTDIPSRGNATPVLKMLRQAESSLADAVAGNVVTDDDEDQVISALVMIPLEHGSANETDFDVGSLLSGNGKDSPEKSSADYWPGFSDRERSIISQVEAPRYFVVLMAYDFQAMWLKHRHRLEWATSFSVRQHGHDFAKELSGMAESASQFFGQDHNGVLRKGLPPGSVSIGLVRSIGDVPAK